jgi:hypothetical protein
MCIAEAQALTRRKKLVIAGIAAARMRSARPRKIKVTDAEGNVVGEEDLSKLQLGLLARADIEFDAEPIPEQLACATCGKAPTPASARNAIAVGTKAYCFEHSNRKYLLLPCVVCGRPSTRVSSNQARSKGTKPTCGDRTCLRALREARRKRPKQQCLRCGKPATMTSVKQPLCANHSKKAAHLTSEQRSARAAKAWATRKAGVTK